MDFKLSDEQRATRDAIKKFMARECSREAARVLDNDKKYPDTLLKSIADMGMCGLMVGENYGGGWC